jgi:hypothetical protein
MDPLSDSEYRINTKYRVIKPLVLKFISENMQDMILARDPLTPSYEEDTFRCTSCFRFKWAYRYPEDQQRESPDHRRCFKCQRNDIATHNMKIREGLIRGPFKDMPGTKKK